MGIETRAVGDPSARGASLGCADVPDCWSQRACLSRRGPLRLMFGECLERERPHTRPLPLNGDGGESASAPLNVEAVEVILIQPFERVALSRCGCNANIMVDHQIRESFAVYQDDLLWNHPHKFLSVF
jgi:hypothetical protein